MSIRSREAEYEERFIASVECACMGGGGGSSSSSSSADNTTTNIDKRQVVDSNSVGVSSDSSTVNVSVLDQGAFQAAVDLAKSNNAAFSDSIGDILGLVKGSMDFTKQAAAGVGDAYANVNDTASGNRALAFAGMAVAGIVAIKMMSKGGKLNV